MIKYSDYEQFKIVTNVFKKKEKKKKKIQIVKRYLRPGIRNLTYNHEQPELSLQLK